jgi:hypothetical protein
MEHDLGVAPGRDTVSLAPVEQDCYALYLVLLLSHGASRLRALVAKI